MSIVRSVENISLGELYRNYTKNKILLPDWQRTLIWNKSKIDKWHDDIGKKGQIPGVIITFNIKGNDVKYLNDGAQRTLSTVKYVEKLQHTHVEKDVIIGMLDDVKLVTQHLEYECMDDAFADFFRINQGTVCTPYELGKGILSTKLQNFKEIWEPLINKLHEIGGDSVKRMQCARVGNSNRENAHKLRRDDFALFLRYVTKEKKTTNDNAGRSRMEKEEIDNQERLNKVIEYRFQQWLNSKGEQEFQKQLLNYEKFINNSLSLYQGIWNELFGTQPKAPTITHVRWFLCVAIYRANNDISIAKFEEFIRKMLSKTEGGSGFVPEGGRDRVTIGLSNLQKLHSFCKYLPIEGFASGVKKRIKRSHTTVKDGYDYSHKFPFAIHGEGDTFLEPHLKNLSRGSRPALLQEVTIKDKIDN